MLVEVCTVGLSLLRREVEGTHFLSSVYSYRGRCIREQVQLPTFPIPGRSDWRLTVILTIRTWAVWGRNQWLSIILPILYTICWISGLVISVRVVDSTTCQSDFHSLSKLSLIYFMEDGAPPYPGFKGCFLTNTSPNTVFLWVMLMVWDSRKFQHVIRCHPSSDWKGIQCCCCSFWFLPSGCVSNRGFDNRFSNGLTFWMSDKEGGNSTLTRVVYRDGKSLGSCCSQVLWILDFGPRCYLLFLSLQ